MGVERISHDCLLNLCRATGMELAQAWKVVGLLGIEVYGEPAKDPRDGMFVPASQLPVGMEHCTIVFKECEHGHGRLTAKNWIDHGCQTCEINGLKQEISDQRDTIKNLKT